MFKNALVSVSDKKNLDLFIKPLAEKGMRVLSTGGTASFLRKQKIKVTEVSEQTKFPEVMNNRVKTLHPFIHMCLLARDDHQKDLELLKNYGLKPIDLLVVNLYPFHEAIHLKEREQVEWIDIGGPTLLRSASKNYFRITVVCDPSDYEWILNKKKLSLKERKMLALKAFSHVSFYDAIITKTWEENLKKENLKEDVKNENVKNFKTHLTSINEKQKSKEEFSNSKSLFYSQPFLKEVSIPGLLNSKLRYGENPKQEGFWYKYPNEIGLHQAKLIQGKSLSFNNLLDLDAAFKTLSEFKDVPSAVAVKHNNPCGVASHASLPEALKKCLKGDPLSVFGGIIAVNGILDLDSVEILKSTFLECILAEDFSKEFINEFQKKKNLRLLKLPKIKSILKSQNDNPSIQFKSIFGGFLIQSPDFVHSHWDSHWEIIGKKPDEKIKEDLLMAWKVCAHLKSNAIAIVSNRQTVGLGMGQVNRVDAVAQAITRMKKFHPQTTEPVLASDAFFPFPDSIEQASKAGIRWIIQPGGSLKDTEVIDAAKKLKIHLILTKKRHFLH